MIELALTILFFISIFAIIRSGRGENDDGEKEKKHPSSQERMKKFVKDFSDKEGYEIYID